MQGDRIGEVAFQPGRDLIGLAFQHWHINGRTILRSAIGKCTADDVLRRRAAVRGVGVGCIRHRVAANYATQGHVLVLSLRSPSIYIM